MTYPTIEDAIGHTPLVALQRIGAQDNAERGNVILGKLEGNNPAGSVKDRPALSMIQRAQERGDIRPGDTLIEATSGNTGIALAMAAAIKGYRMVLIMPEDLSIERAQTMRAFGAELLLTPKAGGMEHARDLADRMQAEGQGRVLDQFANGDNPRIHFETTGPEIWRDTAGGTRGAGGDTVEVEGVGLVDTAVFNPTFEWDLVREFAVLIDLSVVLFQRARGNSDQHYVFDEYTTLDLHQDAEANLKSGFQAWLAAGVMLSLDTFNLRLLGGYGNYVVPVVNFSVPDAIPMIDADIFWRF
jgi:hypothetical protein